MEELFGSDHEFFKIFSSALGGIKLNSKYQIANPQRASRKSSPNSGDGSPASRKNNTTGKKKRKVSRDTLPSIKHGLTPQSWATQSTSAQSERKPPLKLHNKLQKSYQESAQAKRLRLSMMESSMGASYKEYREAELQKLRPNTPNQSRQRRMQDMQYLRKMRKHSEQRVACKNGPTCSNHDWNSRSPIKKVCKRDRNCSNHDWSRVGRQDSPFQVVCKRGPSCKNHDWERRSPMHSDKDTPTSLKIQPDPEATLRKSPEFDSEKFYHQQVEYMRLMQEE